MHSPYFQSEHYKNESAEIRMQDKIEAFLKKILKIILFKK